MENSQGELESPSLPAYDHARLESRRRFLRRLMAIAFKSLARFGAVEGVENIPSSGPAILMFNHIALIDPVAILHAVPRNVVPLAKIEVYHYPIIGAFPRWWDVIPVKRNEFDRQAVQKMFAVLNQGEMILVAPEGTRSPALQAAKEGVAYLATRSGAPVIPVAVDGTIGFPALPFSRRWRGPKITIKFGRAFRFKTETPIVRQKDLRRMMQEAMYLLAALLPPERRGVYADFSQASVDTIEWIGG